MSTSSSYKTVMLYLLTYSMYNLLADSQLMIMVQVMSDESGQRNRSPGLTHKAQHSLQPRHSMSLSPV